LSSLIFELLLRTSFQAENLRKVRYDICECLLLDLYGSYDVFLTILANSGHLKCSFFDLDFTLSLRNLPVNLSFVNPENYKNPSRKDRQ